MHGVTGSHLYCCGPILSFDIVLHFHMVSTNNNCINHSLCNIYLFEGSELLISITNFWRGFQK